MPVTERTDEGIVATPVAVQIVSARPPFTPLRDGDDFAASRSHFGHFMNFLTDGLSEGELIEIRLLGAPQKYGGPKVEFGYFFVSANRDTWDRPWGAVEGVLKRGPQMRPKGMYVTMNPVSPGMLAHANHHLHVAKAESATSDAHVTRRRHFLIDVDPTRRDGSVRPPATICATEAEKVTAHALLHEIVADLTEFGFPEPLTIDSGNGAAALYRIDLPADDGLVERVLKALAKKYDTDDAKVDTAVFNAARITRLPGTWNAKGDDTPTVGRRHRMARVLRAPQRV